MLAYTHYENDPRVIRAAEAALEGGFCRRCDCFDGARASFRLKLFVAFGSSVCSNDTGGPHSVKYCCRM